MVHGMEVGMVWKEVQHDLTEEVKSIVCPRSSSAAGRSLRGSLLTLGPT